MKKSLDWQRLPFKMTASYERHRGEFDSCAVLTVSSTSHATPN